MLTRRKPHFPRPFPDWTVSYSPGTLSISWTFESPDIFISYSVTHDQRLSEAFGLRGLWVSHCCPRVICVLRARAAENLRKGFPNDANSTQDNPYSLLKSQLPIELSYI